MVGISWLRHHALLTCSLSSAREPAITDTDQPAGTLPRFQAIALDLRLNAPFTACHPVARFIPARKTVYEIADGVRAPGDWYNQHNGQGTRTYPERF